MFRTFINLALLVLCLFFAWEIFAGGAPPDVSAWGNPFGKSNDPTEPERVVHGVDVDGVYPIYEGEYKTSNSSLHGDYVYPDFFGVDITQGCGAKVIAPFDGRVTQNAYEAWIGPHDSKGTGNSYIIIRSDDGRREVLIYHGNWTAPVGPIKAGDVLGAEDRIGNSTGCHAHVVLHVDGVLVNYLSHVTTWERREVYTKRGGTGGEISPIFPEYIQVWGSDIARWGSESGIDPDLIASLILVESCGDQNAVSSANAAGLMQLMPQHVIPGTDIFDPDTNAGAGTKYINEGFSYHNGDLNLTISGYNMGHYGAATTPFAAYTDETKLYLHLVSSVYADAVAGLNSSPTVESEIRGRRCPD